MNIRRFVVLAAAGFALVGFAAENNAPRKKPGKPTGGFLEAVNTGRVIQVVNNQKVCPPEMFAKSLDRIKDQFHFPFETTAKALTGRRDANAAARVVLVEHDDAPVLLCAPEDGWCELNVKPLTVDDPTEYALRIRLEKEMLRALGYALGCGNSSVQPCVMCEIDSLKALDSASRTMGPDAQGKTRAVALSRGSVFRRFASYRRACQEGWAPAPTNDIQKAIWTEVHTMPTKPLKIKFDPAAQKGKVTK